MAINTTELTHKFIQEHPQIKHCLKKGLINYSSLARHISDELNLKNKASNESILVAARRVQEKIKNSSDTSKEINELLNNSEVEIKTKILVLIVKKPLQFDKMLQIQNKIKSEGGLFFMLDGSNHFTLITQQKYEKAILVKFKQNTIKVNSELALVTIKSSQDIEKIPGVVSYLTSLFSENDVNICEFLSCWTDTMFVIDSKDLNKALTFLNFGSY